MNPRYLDAINGCVIAAKPSTLGEFHTHQDIETRPGQNPHQKGYMVFDSVNVNRWESVELFHSHHKIIETIDPLMLTQETVNGLKKEIATLKTKLKEGEAKETESEIEKKKTTKERLTALLNLGPCREGNSIQAIAEETLIRLINTSCRGRENHEYKLFIMLARTSDTIKALDDARKAIRRMGLQERTEIK